MKLLRKIACMVSAAALATLVSAGPALSETTLNFATTLPEGNPLVVQVFKPWVDRLNERGKGVVRINMINGPTVASHANVYNRVSSGIVDMGWAILGSVGVPFPRSEVVALPFLAPNPETASRALWGVYKEGLLDDDFDGISLVALLALPSAGLHSNEPILSSDDLKGRKVRVADKISSRLMTAMGATPVSITTADSYQAIETGVLDAIYTGWAGCVLFKLEEVTDQHLDEDIGSGAAAIFVNEGVYQGLDDEAKAILAEGGDDLVATLSAWYVKIDGIFRGKVEATGDTINRLPEEELAKWQGMTGPIIDGWAEETPNGEKILARFRELLADG